MNKQKLSPPDFTAQAELQTVHLQGSDLQLYVPNVRAVQDAYRQGGIPFPYWSKIWPAAIAMGEYLLLHSEVVKNKKVLELGAGLGLPSIIAARYAISVVCTDHSAEAVAFANLSATHNQLKNFHASVLDWNETQEKIEADVVLLSDINYEPVAFDALMKMIFSFLQNGITILLSTPQRLMAKEFITAILPFCKTQEDRSVNQNGNGVTISLLLLRK